MMVYCRLRFVLGIMLMPVALAHASAEDDAYIAGYATGVLKHGLKLDTPPLNVRDGVITLPAAGLKASDRAKAVQILAEIPGVNAVKLSETTRRQPMMSTASRSVQVGAEEAGSTNESVVLPTGLLPVGHLFKPLLADPLWAHFSAAFRNYQNDSFDGRDIASVNFGETIPFYRGNFGQSTVQ